MPSGRSPLSIRSPGRSRRLRALSQRLGPPLALGVQDVRALFPAGPRHAWGLRAACGLPEPPGAVRPHGSVLVRAACGALCVCEVLTVSRLSAPLSLEFTGGRDTAVPQSEDNQPRASQFLRVQREEEEKPVPALHLPSCQR